MIKDFKFKELEDDTDYTIMNYQKFYWYDTQAYELSRDDNEGNIYGYVQWYGDQSLDDAIDNDGGSDVKWSWFKTEQERDKSFGFDDDKKIITQDMMALEIASIQEFVNELEGEK